MDIKVNFHSSILIDNQIYVDPLKVKGDTKAKFVFVTHSHWDHFSPDDINKIATSETKFVCPKSMKEEFLSHFSNQVLFVEPNKQYDFGGLKFETIASYNKNKKFHSKENGWVGYTIVCNGERVTVVGDSDATDELLQVKTEVLLVPVGGTYTMTVQEAADLTNKIKPKKVIPTHYGEVVGDKNCGKEFAKLLDKDIECEILI